MIEQPKTNALDAVLGLQRTVDRAEHESSCSSPSACSVSPAAQPPRDVAELYHELLYAVARKFPGESRHETALRYIRDAEERARQTGSCKQNGKDDTPK